MDEYTFTEQELAELKDVFFNEASEILQSLNQEVLDLESGGDRDESLKNIQRYLHTFKGNSRALGFTCLNTLSHKSEDLLRTVHDDSLDVDRGLIDLLFAINDNLQLTVDGYRTDVPVSVDGRLFERIEAYLSTTGNNGSAGKHPGPPPPSVSKDNGAGVYDIFVAFNKKCKKKSSGVRKILKKIAAHGNVLDILPRIDSSEIEEADRFTILFGSADPSALPEQLLAIPSIVETVEIKKHESEATGQPAPVNAGPAVQREQAQMLRVEAQRVDKILNLVGELVIGRSIVGQVVSEIEDQFKKEGFTKKLSEADAFMEKTLSQLQKNVMKIRMLPISQVFRKFPRVVRDLSVEKDKEVELVMQGEKTELDKSLLDAIGEPLIHLVRNAVDHGIESPEERQRLGKPRTGTITLKASHDGNQIVIDVKDDGAGFDPAKFRESAVAKGIKTREEADRLSDGDAMDLIFLSGFSTADVVTDISGRGYGMDIVRTTVEALKGRIQVRSQPGEGSVFTLRLPLTLAIIRAMLFWAGNKLFALPMSSIEKITRVKDSTIQTVSGKRVLRFREKVISLIALDESLDLRGSNNGSRPKKFVIVVGLADKLYGFLVDRLVGQQELVIKVLDNHWGTVNCSSGASIQGDGRVVLILDAAALVTREIQREAQKA
ncbi:MAG TPA: hypothetical protein DCO77_12940 [Nitrospiraceae bacterium]|nr:hypothetical protein [Nitrospiraceae bacterium]